MIQHDSFHTPRRCHLQRKPTVYMDGKVASCWSCWCWVEILYQQKSTPKKGIYQWKKSPQKECETMNDNNMFGLASWFGLKKHLKSKGWNDDSFLFAAASWPMYSFMVISGSVYRVQVDGACLSKKLGVWLYDITRKNTTSWDPVENWTRNPSVFILVHTSAE